MADPSRYQGLINAAKAGVVIGFGTDAGSPVVGHDVIAPEMAFMVKLGVKRDNYDAIQHDCSRRPDQQARQKKIGTLEPGKLADVIIINGNPLENIDAIGHVRMTFVEGKRL